MAQDLNRRKILAGLAITAASGLLHSQASTRVHASPKIPDTPWKAGIARAVITPIPPSGSQATDPAELPTANSTISG
jgi:hypothetical protein